MKKSELKKVIKEILKNEMSFAEKSHKALRESFSIKRFISKLYKVQDILSDLMDDIPDFEDSDAYIASGKPKTDKLQRSVKDSLQKIELLKTVLRKKYR